MQLYAAMCSYMQLHMQLYAAIWSYMQLYAIAYADAIAYAATCSYMQLHACICMYGFAICIYGFPWTSKDIHGHPLRLPAGLLGHFVVEPPQIEITICLRFFGDLSLGTPPPRTMDFQGSGYFQ